MCLQSQRVGTSVNQVLALRFFFFWEHNKLMTFTQEASFTRKWFSGRSCIRSNWKFRIIFEERGKPGKKLLEAEQRSNIQLNPYMVTSMESIPVHISGRRKQSPLRHPCSLSTQVVLLVTYIVPKGAIWSRSRGSRTVHSFFVWNQTFVRFQWFFCLSSSHLQTKRRRALTSWVKS